MELGYADWKGNESVGGGKGMDMGRAMKGDGHGLQFRIQRDGDPAFSCAILAGEVLTEGHGQSGCSGIVTLQVQ